MVIQAKDHLHPQGLIVESASILADALIGPLQEGMDVEVSFAGIKGASSSYFNVLLGRLADVFGIDVIDRQIRFQFDSEVQKQVFGRSLESLKKAIAS